MPTDDAIRGLKLAKQAKVLAEKVAVLESDITEYNKKIIALDGIIQTYKRDSVTNAAMIASFERDKANMIAEAEGLRNDKAALQKTIKKLNRKVRWTAISGLAGMATMAFLLLTK